MRFIHVSCCLRCTWEEETDVLPENSNFNGLPRGEASTFSETGKRFD